MPKAKPKRIIPLRTITACALRRAMHDAAVNFQTDSSGKHLYRTLKNLQTQGYTLSKESMDWIRKFEKYGDYFWMKNIEGQ